MNDIGRAHRGRKGFVGLVVASLLLAAAPQAQAAPAAAAAKTLAAPSVTEGPARVARTIAGGHRFAASGTGCVSSAKGHGVCIADVPEGKLPALLPADGAVSAAAVRPVPDWCYEGADSGYVYYLRFEACDISTTSLETYQTINGVRTTTGMLYTTYLSYTYMERSQSNWGHQLGVVTRSGWGDALGARISATATASGQCTRISSSFAGLGATPFEAPVTGEAYFSSTATAAGAQGPCETTWTYTYRVPGYNNASGTASLVPVRCDNATGGVAYAGCVIPTYPSQLVYSRARMPKLANHVAQAQASGLPGGSFDRPLTRLTNDTLINLNRGMACGDKPTIEGLSCDEYPVASSKQGLAIGGGSRRTFDNCGFTLPRATGPAGVSVCMVPDSEQSSQGGSHTQFFRYNRILEDDPFVIEVGP